ncbi:hypothetical protein I3U56_14450 [Mycobacteroides abscessus subsp. abscessus]|uniref:hypothetical protein n=1 Tax=Mycobacteroides abscessus TaxID=36809 RepID=UPI0019CFA27B|nr:hypothetical protein [Mycobacteroides abscessus]MBN7491646.1 hypothetical protein [Mycobacteroides abscessus subsp. abscessus]
MTGFAPPSTPHYSDDPKGSALGAALARNALIYAHAGYPACRTYRNTVALDTPNIPHNSATGSPD